jgi:hypothetical protein
MVLKFNGNFNLAINTLMEKARKAYFEIKKTIDEKEALSPLENFILHMVSIYIE